MTYRVRHLQSTSIPNTSSLSSQRLDFQTILRQLHELIQNPRIPHIHRRIERRVITSFGGSPNYPCIYKLNPRGPNEQPGYPLHSLRVHSITIHKNQWPPISSPIVQTLSVQQPLRKRERITRR